MSSANTTSASAVYTTVGNMSYRNYHLIEKNDRLKKWIAEKIELLKPDNVWICDGSMDENQEILDNLVKAGIFTKLNDKKRPNSYLARSDPSDVARVEKCTYICSENEKDAGPTNNWMEPSKMRAILNDCFNGSMKGRTLYVIPFSMGPVGGDLSRIGIQLTDSGYVVVNMRIMTKMGKAVLEALKEDQEFIPCVHSVGHPLEKGEKDVAWPCNNQNKYIVQFPETHQIWSFGSGYGGNALLGKKCFALRIATSMCREEGDALAEHMLILGLTNPQGKKYYVCAAFPSACGKTNLAMLNPTLEGWKVECVGDDIAWLKLNKEDGRLYAINPEAGFFGVAPGTSMKSNPNAMLSCSKDTIFTNVALTEDGDVWWEGMSKEYPEGKTINWLGKEFDSKTKPADALPLAHPNSRFTACVENCPVADKDYYGSGCKPVPVSAFIFGGRRENTVPLVLQSRDWNHGVLLGSSVASERTAAAEGKQGTLRFDPFAMLPFCGYNMGDYFGYWLSFADKVKDPNTLPKIFNVNWFRKENGRFLWPGYGENSRVLKWIVDRIEGKEGTAVETPVGYLPTVESLDLTGLDDLPREDLQKILTVDIDAYLDEVQKVREYHSQFGDRLPPKLSAELDALEARLKQAKK